jgi:hypothetical protein
MPGVRYNRFTMAVGAGFDQYPQWQTLPLFAGVGYDILNRRQHAFFLHFNAGFSKAWSTLTDDEAQVRHRHEGGYMYHPFLGYRVRQGKITLYFSMGYKFQTVTYKHIPTWRDEFGIVHEWTGTRTTIERRMERVSVQMGIGLN